MCAVENIPCRFLDRGCKHPAVAVYYLPAGCVCWKDPVQALCWQHVEKATDIGGMTKLAQLIEIEIVKGTSRCAP